MKTEIITDTIERAAELLRAGELVAVPTETVYGLAGNGLDAAAVEMIYEVKGRPAVKPLALMVPDAGDMEKYCEDVPEQAKKLAEKFWPGPLSIVLKSKDIVPDIVRAGGDTVSLRCPDHPVTLALLRQAGIPFAAPSANPSGEESPKNAETVVKYFDGCIAAVIDGGECGLGRESTIIDMSKTPYRVLRQGALPEAEIVDALTEGMTVVGITGGTGCGKTTALQELQRLGALIVDCDALYHKMLGESGELLADIKSAFPEAFPDGEFDRKALGKAVFGDEKKLEKLNGITHRHIIAASENLLRAHAMGGGNLAAVDAVALIESGMAARCDLVIGVTADQDSRIERIMERDGISREYAQLRVDAQQPDEFYEHNCDYILRNDGSEAAFRERCRNLYKEVLT